VKGRRSKMELTTVVVMAMAVAVALSSVGAATAASSPTYFPLDCASYVLDGRAVPYKVCCIEVQDQFLLKKGVGIEGYCKAVKAVNRFNGNLVGTELDLALSVPNKCGLSSYFKKGSLCAGKVIPGGV
jgi:hypothetical protein